MPVNNVSLSKSQKSFTHQDFLDGKCTADGLPLDGGGFKSPDPVVEEVTETVAEPVEVVEEVTETAAEPVEEVVPEEEVEEAIEDSEPIEEGDEPEEIVSPT